MTSKHPLTCKHNRALLQKAIIILFNKGANALGPELRLSSCDENNIIEDLTLLGIIQPKTKKINCVSQIEANALLAGAITIAHES